MSLILKQYFHSVFWLPPWFDPLSIKRKLSHIIFLIICLSPMTFRILKNPSKLILCGSYISLHSLQKKQLATNDSVGRLQARERPKFFDGWVGRYNLIGFFTYAVHWLRCTGIWTRDSKGKKLMRNLISNFLVFSSTLNQGEILHCNSDPFSKMWGHKL